VKQARHRKSEIEAEYRRLERTVSTEIRSVYLDLKTQEKVIDSLEQEVKSATANYEQIVAQFNEGLVTAVDVVDAQTALNEAERRLSLAFYNYQLNLLRLRLATGTFEQERVSRYLKGVAGSDTLHREGDAQ
jgi:outer membrane protein TolC